MLKMKQSTELIHKIYTDLGHWQVKHQVDWTMDRPSFSRQWKRVPTELHNKPTQQVMMMLQDSQSKQQQTNQLTERGSFLRLSKVKVPDLKHECGLPKLHSMPLWKRHHISDLWSLPILTLMMEEMKTQNIGF